MIYFTADTHFAHGNIIQMANRPFHSVEEMNKALIQNWNAKVSDNDDIYILGDFTLKGPLLANELLKQLHGMKMCLRGNHDRFIERQSFRQNAFVWVKDYFELCWQQQYFILSHYPLLSWNGMWRGSFNLHGHCHNKMEYNLANRAAGVRRIDVGVDAFGMAPVSIEEVLTFFGDEEK